MENKFSNRQSIKSITFINRLNVKYEVTLTCHAYALLPLMLIYQWLLIASHITPGLSLKRHVEYIQQYTTGILGGFIITLYFSSLFFFFYILFFLLFQIFFFLFFSRIFFSFFLPPSNLTLELALRLSQMPKFDFKDLTIVDQPASNAIVQSMHQKVKKRNAQIIIENRNLFSSRT